MSFWAGKRVFLTGHTGFKGAWLTVWLHELGAHVGGYSLAPDSNPSLFEQLQLEECCEQHTIDDINDLGTLKRAMQEFAPDIVIHMAAQSLVRKSYREPINTIATNITGTAHVLEACRDIDTIRAALMVTTDKCYKNKETGQFYKEDDELGGRDVYSASKACAEIITHSYRQSFFDASNIRIGSARAGNVIGAGDWSEDRLIPDAARAFVSRQELVIRSPKSLRPWQHVVEPLSGYLMFAQAMAEHKSGISDAYNFGPDAPSVVPVEHVIKHFAHAWGTNATWRIDPPKDMPHEASLLALDSTRAKRDLGWKPVFTIDEMLKRTAEGYQYTTRGDVLSHMQKIFSFVAM